MDALSASSALTYQIVSLTLTRILPAITISNMDSRQLALWSQTSSPSHVARNLAAGSPHPAASLTGESRPLHDAPALEELDACTQYFIENSQAQCTRDAYARDFLAFEAWCSGNGLRSLPADVSTLTRYLTFLAQCGRKVSTVRRARIAIGRAHAAAGASRSDRDARIRTLDRRRAHPAQEPQRVGSDRYLRLRGAICPGRVRLPEWREARPRGFDSAAAVSHRIERKRSAEEDHSAALGRRAVGSGLSNSAQLSASCESARSLAD